MLENGNHDGRYLQQLFCQQFQVIVLRRRPHSTPPASAQEGQIASTYKSQLPRVSKRFDTKRIHFVFCPHLPKNSIQHGTFLSFFSRHRCLRILATPLILFKAHQSSRGFPLVHNVVMKRRSSFLSGSISDALCPVPAKTSRLEVERDEPGTTKHQLKHDPVCVRFYLSMLCLPKSGQKKMGE